MNVTTIRLDDKCQLCRQHTADHIWQRDHVIGLCGRCFYWLVEAQNIPTLSYNFKPIDIVKIVADYRAILAGGGNGARFFLETAVTAGVDVGAIRQMIRGDSFKALYDSMIQAGIPGPGYRPEQVAHNKREAILGGGLFDDQQVVVYSRPDITAEV